MTARLYIVEFMNERARLIKATSQAQAINHVIKPFYTARIAKPLEVADMLADGHILGDATAAPVQGDEAAQNENQLQDMQKDESA